MIESRVDRLLRPLRATLLAPMSAAALIVWLPILLVCIVVGALLDIAGRRDLAVILFVLTLLWVAGWCVCNALALRKLQRQQGYPPWRRTLAQIGWLTVTLSIEAQYVMNAAPFPFWESGSDVPKIVASDTAGCLVIVGFLLLAGGAAGLKIE